MGTVNEASGLVTKATSVKVDRRNPLSLRLKRTMDLIGSTTLLLLTWPLFLIVALAIKVDSPGPVYFRRRVAGQHGKEFEVLKFRSMVANAHGLLLADPELLDGRVMRLEPFAQVRRRSEEYRLHSPRLLLSAARWGARAYRRADCHASSCSLRASGAANESRGAPAGGPTGGCSNVLRVTGGRPAGLFPYSVA